MVQLAVAHQGIIGANLQPALAKVCIRRIADIAVIQPQRTAVLRPQPNPLLPRSLCGQPGSESNGLSGRPLGHQRPAGRHGNPILGFKIQESARRHGQRDRVGYGSQAQRVTAHKTELRPAQRHILRNSGIETNDHLITIVAAQSQVGVTGLHIDGALVDRIRPRTAIAVPCHFNVCQRGGQACPFQIDANTAAVLNLGGPHRKRPSHPDMSLIPAPHIIPGPRSAVTDKYMLQAARAARLKIDAVPISDCRAAAAAAGRHAVGVIIKAGDSNRRRRTARRQQRAAYNECR